jgi:dihydroorotase
MQEITLRTPDDWHIHLRDGELLQQTVPDAARQFGRAIVMPNLVPPVRNSTQAAAYRDRILAEVPQGLSFDPLMVLYLTDSTTAADIHEAHQKRICEGREALSGRGHHQLRLGRNQSAPAR